MQPTPRRARRRATAATTTLSLSLLSWAAPRAALAQDPPATTGWALDRYDPAPAGDRSFAAHLPWYNRPASAVDVRGGIRLDYARNPLVLRTGGVGSGVSRAVVENMLVGHAQIGIAFVGRLNVHLSVPVSLWQSGERENNVGLGAANFLAAGDPRLGVRLRIAGDAQREPISVHVSAEGYFNAGLFGVPAGANTTDGQFRGRFGLLLAGRGGPVRWSFQAGAHVRPGLDVANTAIGSEGYFNAGVMIVTAEERLTVGPEIFGSTVFDRAFQWRHTNLEALMGAHYLIGDAFLIGLGAGFGLTQGAGTPSVRALLHLAYAPGERLPPGAAPGAPDTDRDGIFDNDDLCPREPAGTRPDPRLRGCPQRDQDRDGIFDNDDQCVTEPQGEHPDPDHRGCPLRDRDRDTVLDPQDICPDVPRGEHPDPERLGCPDGDEDSDGFYNHQDVCPREPAGLQPDPARLGCPLPDRDHDTVPDATDACPDRPGMPHPNPRRNGCPGLVLIENGQLRILRPVFFATNRDRILPRSFPVLLAVQEVLAASPFLRRVSIQGHTDDVGNDDANQDLSNRRAASVMRWLVEHGISSERLESRGLGETRPLTDVTGMRGQPLRSARARDRRVEFRIVDAPTQPANDPRTTGNSNASTTPAPVTAPAPGSTPAPAPTR